MAAVERAWRYNLRYGIEMLPAFAVFIAIAAYGLVIAFDSDPVATGVEHRELTTLAILRVTGQPQATIYRPLKVP